MQASYTEQSPSLLGTVARWWRNWKSSRARIAELSNFTPKELHDVARDIGCTDDELKALAGKWPDSADLLTRRMAALGFYTAELERTQPSVSNDLRKSCSLCVSKRRCEHDLVENPADPVWKEYCPNSGTLEALCEVQQKHDRRAWQVPSQRRSSSH